MSRFVEFNSGPDAVPDSAFDIPLDLVCKGRLPGQPLPQFSDFFTAGIETVYSTTVSSFLVSVYCHTKTEKMFLITCYYSLCIMEQLFGLVLS